MFTLQRTLKTTVGYPEYQIISEGEESTVEVTYTAQAITSISGSRCDAIFGVKISGVDPVGSLNFHFQYDGVSNPFEAAEIALKEYLTTNQ